MKTLVFLYIVTIALGILSMLLLWASIYLNGRAFGFFIVSIITFGLEIQAIKDQKRIIK